MTVREILPFGDSVLRKVCKPVTEMTPRIVTLLDDLKDTLYAEPGRAGLAAPQIGLLRRVVVMDVGEGFKEFINPEIVEAEGEIEGMEGCLSLPGYYGMVKRYAKVKVRSMARDGSEVWTEAEGFYAVCIQHELDHLDGILFIDRMTDPVLVNDKTKHRMQRIDAINQANAAVCNWKPPYELK